MKIQHLTKSALLIALAIILSRIPIVQLPFGGSITFFSMLPLVLVGYLYGLSMGVLAGLVFGFLNFILANNPFVVHYIQLILDYFLAFIVLGFSGFFSKWKYKYSLEISYIVAVILRYLVSVLSGVVFFSEYAPEGTTGLWYSITYNMTYIVPEMLLTLLLIPFLKHIIEKVK